MTAPTSTEMTRADTEVLRELGQQLRVDSIRCSTAAGSGHPTSSMSAADLIAVLLSRHLVYDWSKPDQPTNDHLIYSKGHASPLCYAMFKAAGVITDEELLTYRTFGSRLQGHPTPALPWVDVATAIADRPVSRARGDRRCAPCRGEGGGPILVPNGVEQRHGGPEADRHVAEHRVQRVPEPPVRAAGP
jgi:hypothetical protein